SNDFMDSPIITVLAEIKEQLEKTIDKRYLKQETKASLKEIGMTVLPKILAALVKRYGGFDINELLEDSKEGSNSNNDASSSESDDSKNKLDLSAVAEAMATQAFKEYSDYKNGVDELKSTIKKLIEHCIKHPKESHNIYKKEYPAFIFIDELDRCRPTYAVEMLEAIKHLFNIDGLVIVVSTHTEELQHTIKALYGSDFNADDYLRRFFDTKYNLEVKLSKELFKANCDLSVLEPDILTTQGKILFPVIQVETTNKDDYESEVLSIFLSIASWLNLSPRSAIQFVDRCLVCIELLDENKTYDLILISVLVGLYMFRYGSDYPILTQALLEASFSVDHLEYEELFDNLVDNGKVIDVESFIKLKSNLSGIAYRDCYPQNYFGAEKKPYQNELDVLERMFYPLNKKNQHFAIHTYFQYLIKVMKMTFEKSKRLNDLVGYDGLQCSESQTTRAMMLFFGLDKTTINDYFKLVELSSRFEE
ncbi:MAG: P-loop NTPase fold protein, partial [Pseudomonadota bacterium]